MKQIYTLFMISPKVHKAFVHIILVKILDLEGYLDGCIIGTILPLGEEESTSLPEYLKKDKSPKDGGFIGSALSILKLQYFMLSISLS